MSWIAAVGGFLLVPVVGSLAARVVSDVAKPQSLSSVILIGAAAHAVGAVAASAVSDHVKDDGLRSFAHGGVWGEGIAAGLLGISGLYALTPGGKAALADGGQLSREFALLQSGTPTTPSTTPTSLTPKTSGTYGGSPVPAGLLGLLTAAKAHGY